MLKGIGRALQIRTIMTQTPKEKLIFAPETYQYKKGHLNAEDLSQSPIDQFDRWFEEARKLLPQGSLAIPELTNLATARLPSGRVSSRMVLLKELDPTGFIVYSNWEVSKKAQDYDTNKYAALNFFWSYLERQVRVEGIMERLSTEQSQAYFNTRPRDSRVGAWSSPQLQVIKDRQELQRLFDENNAKFGDTDAQIPCPEFWGGMRIVPLEIEFWQGGVNRLHDRLTYRRNTPDSEWQVTRIAP